MLYKTNVALSVKGDRIEKGAEIDLTPDEVAGFDPADITALAEIPAPEPEIDLSTIPLEELSFAELKLRAKELGLSASGSKADIEERIRLHLDGANGTEEEEVPEDEDGANGTEEDLSEPNQ